MRVSLESQVVLLALLAICTGSHAQPATAPADEVVTGLVVGADGKPLAGATVVLAVPVAAEPGNERPPWEVRVEQHQAVSGDDGAFALPGTGRTSDALWLLVSTDDGAAQMRIDAADRGKRHVLRVQPYGRVEGVIMRGTKPLPGEMVTCHSTAVDIGGGVLGEPLVQFREQTRADPRGKFIFPRVPPGRHEVGHMVVRRVGRSRMLTLTHATPVTVESNETTNVTIGGTGRPVTGSFTSSDSIDWSRVHAALSQELEDGSKREYLVTIEADGTFRADDVPAGTYALALVAMPAPGSDGQPPQFVPKREQIDVPPMPGGRSGEPLDVGRIEVERRKKP